MAQNRRPRAGQQNDGYHAIRCICIKSGNPLLQVGTPALVKSDTAGPDSRCVQTRIWRPSGTGGRAQAHCNPAAGLVRTSDPPPLSLAQAARSAGRCQQPCPHICRTPSNHRLAHLAWSIFAPGWPRCNNVGEHLLPLRWANAGRWRQRQERFGRPPRAIWAPARASHFLNRGHQCLPPGASRPVGAQTGQQDLRLGEQHADSFCSGYRAHWPPTPRAPRDQLDIICLRPLAQQYEPSATAPARRATPAPARAARPPAVRPAGGIRRRLNGQYHPDRRSIAAAMLTNSFQFQKRGRLGAPPCRDAPARCSSSRTGASA